MNKRDWSNCMRTIPAIVAAVITSVRSSSWFSVKDYSGVRLVVGGSVGRAADDVAITFRQATSAAGAGAKAITPRTATLREGSSLATAAAATATRLENPESVTLQGDMVNILEVEFDAAELDLKNDFAYVQARSAAVGSATKTVTFAGDAVGARQMLAPELLRNPLV